MGTAATGRNVPGGKWWHLWVFIGRFYQFRGVKLAKPLFVIGALRIQIDPLSRALRRLLKLF